MNALSFFCKVEGIIGVEIFDQISRRDHSTQEAHEYSFSSNNNNNQNSFNVSGESAKDDEVIFLKVIPRRSLQAEEMGVNRQSEIFSLSRKISNGMSKKESLTEEQKRQIIELQRNEDICSKKIVKRFELNKWAVRRCLAKHLASKGSLKEEHKGQIVEPRRNESMGRRTIAKRLGLKPIRHHAINNSAFKESFPEKQQE